VHGQGSSSECSLGVQGMLSIVKQWQAELLHPLGQLHSEQRCRQIPPLSVEQQNHSPEVLQPVGQPPPWMQVLQGYAVGLSWSQSPTGDQHGLQGPPPHPTQPPDTDPTETPVLVRNKPVPSEPAAMNLKNWRLEERRASA
jgi:hypothetical protein